MRLYTFIWPAARLAGADTRRAQSASISAARDTDSETTLQWIIHALPEDPLTKQAVGLTRDKPLL